MHTAPHIPQIEADPPMSQPEAAPHIPQLATAAIGSPITRLGVSFFPVYLATNGLPKIATGTSSGLEIEELGSAEVPTLSVHNPTKVPALIIEGEHLVGGKQNRSVNTSVLVPSMARLEIPVTCLEQGRWGRSRAYERAQSHTPARVRAINVQAVDENVRAFNSREGDQGTVWSAVEDVLEEMDMESPTAAAADADRVYRRDVRRQGAFEELSRLGPLPGQCGFAVAHGRRIVSIELFGAAELLRAHWSAMIRSHLLEPGKPSGRPSATAVLSMLRRLGSLPPKVSPGIGLGTEMRVRDRGIVGQALTLEHSAVHCSAFRRQVKSRRRRWRPVA